MYYTIIKNKEDKDIVQNGLTLCSVNSQVVWNTKNDSQITPEDIDQTTADYFKNPAFVVAYLYSCIKIGMFEQQKFTFYPHNDFHRSQIIRLRIFNEDGELHIWKSGRALKGRMRLDLSLDENHEEGFQKAIMADQVLLGTSSGEPKNGWVPISEERGGVFYLPSFKNMEKVNTKDDPESRVCIRTMNYVGVNDVGLSTYMDNRFVCFTQKNRILK